MLQKGVKIRGWQRSCRRGAMRSRSPRFPLSPFQNHHASTVDQLWVISGQ